MARTSPSNRAWSLELWEHTRGEAELRGEPVSSAHLCRTVRLFLGEPHVLRQKNTVVRRCRGGEGSGNGASHEEHSESCSQILPVLGVPQRLK